MSNNKSFFGPIYYSHIKLNNHHAFITISAHTILSNIDIHLGQLAFIEIIYTQPLIFQNKLISIKKTLWRYVT